MHGRFQQTAAKVVALSSFLQIFQTVNILVKTSSFYTVDACMNIMLRKM